MSHVVIMRVSHIALGVKNPPANAGDMVSGSRRSPGRKWQPIPVFLLGEFHGQQSLAGYSPLGHKESDMTE